MIVITKLNPTGFFSYGRHDTIDIDGLGTCLLDGVNLDKQGGSNASGKTSLFNTMCHLLFGENPSGETADDITNAIFGKRFGMLEFMSHSGEKWRIIETRKWKKSDKVPDDTILSEPSVVMKVAGGYTGSDVYLEKWNGSEWLDERGTNAVGKMKLTVEATREKIRSILRCNYKQFIDTCYLVQQEGLRLIKGKHKEKYEVIARLANTEEWERRRSAVESDRLRLEAETEKDRATSIGLEMNKISLERQIKELEGLTLELALIEPQISKVESEIATLEAELTLKTLNLEASSNSRDEALKGMQTDMSKLSEIKDAIRDEQTRFEREYDSIRRRQPSIDILNREHRVVELNVVISNLTQDLNNMIPGAGKCNTCKSYVTSDHIERHRQLIKMQIKEVEAELNQVRSELSELEKEHGASIERDLIEAETKSQLILASLRHQYDEVNSKMNEWGKIAEESLLGWKSLEGECARLKSDILRMNSDLKEKIIKREGIKMGIKHAELNRETAKAQDDTLSSLGEKIAKADKRIKHMQTVERLFGDRGMQAFVLEKSVKQLNKYIAQNLKRIGSKVAMWATCFKEKSDGNVGIDIQVYVKDGPKDRIPFSLYSGSERAILSLILMDSYSEVASLAGIGFNVLFLDEIFGPLDGTNAADVLEYVRQMSAKNRSSIFVTTHSEKVKDSSGFDSHIIVTKKSGTSTVDIKVINERRN